MIVAVCDSDTETVGDCDKLLVNVKNEPDSETLSDSDVDSDTVEETVGVGGGVMV